MPDALARAVAPPSLPVHLATWAGTHGLEPRGLKAALTVGL